MAAEAALTLPIFIFRQAGIRRYLCCRLIAGIQAFVEGARAIKWFGAQEIIMACRYTLLGAVTLAVISVAGAQAQSQSPFPPAGPELQASPFPAPSAAPQIPMLGPQSRPQPQQQQQGSACVDQYLPLREEVDKRFEATKAGIARKGGAPEICNLLTKFSQAEAALMKFIEKNTGNCPFPPNMLENIKASNVKSEGYRKQACTAAAAPARPTRPTEPTLSDALSPPALNKDNTRTGRGTLDSLGGNPLAR
jgi:hypothetical protein